jgi:membrane protein YdbS with pleckstrin-like domain
VAAGTGLWIALAPETIVNALPPFPPAGASFPQAAVGLIRLLGLCMLVTALSWISFRRLYAHYVATQDALQSRYGIVSRTIVKAMYAHVFSVDVHQGVIERLINVGTVEVSTAATNDSDVSFRGVANPMALAGEISRRIAYYNAHRRPRFD